MNVEEALAVAADADNEAFNRKEKALAVLADAVVRVRDMGEQWSTAGDPLGGSASGHRLLAAIEGRGAE